MIAYKNSLSFGRYLKTIRREKGISLQEVSRKTKIGVDTLLLIEKEDHGGLPAEVFVKGFLRAYAKAIGVDDDVVIQRYLSDCRALQGTTGFDIDQNGSRPKFWLRLALSLGALGCIIALSVFTISFFQGEPSNDNSNGQRSIKENKNNIDVGDSQKSDSERKSPKSLSGRLLLKIITIEDTWIKVTTDDHEPKEYSLHTRDRLELEATSGFHLLIGNAGGIRLILNEKPLEIHGKSGQVLSIRVP
ncbi:RodZ domain-containing protein [Thermodesulfobacteriota bacterium]